MLVLLRSLRLQRYCDCEFVCVCVCCCYCFSTPLNNFRKSGLAPTDEAETRTENDTELSTEFSCVWAFSLDRRPLGVLGQKNKKPS
jgi:hypothetical protein